MKPSVTQSISESRTAPATMIGFAAHLEFFDRDGDQKISLPETLVGLRRIGFGRLIAVPGTVLIHAGVAGLGLARGELQNPLQLSIPSVSVLRHPDTAMVDDRDPLNEKRFQEAFATHGHQYGGDALTFSEMVRMACSQLWTETHGVVELLLLPGGAAATFVEWGALFWLARERHDGELVLTRDAARRFYVDPQFFHNVARRLERSRKWRERSVAGRMRNLVQDWLL